MSGDGNKSNSSNLPENLCIAVVVQPAVAQRDLRSPAANRLHGRLLTDSNFPKDILIRLGREASTSFQICQQITKAILQQKGVLRGHQPCGTKEDKRSAEPISKQDVASVSPTSNRGFLSLRYRTQKVYDSDSSSSEGGDDYSASSSKKIADNKYSYSCQKYKSKPVQHSSRRDRVEFEKDRRYKKDRSIADKPFDYRKIITLEGPCVEKPPAIIRDRSCPFELNEKVPPEASCFGGEKPDPPVKLVTHLND